MKKTLEQIEESLFAEANGSVFAKIKDKLITQFAPDNRSAVLAILMRYVRNGNIVHWRNFLLTDILKLVNENEVGYAGFFEWTVQQPALAYWGVDGVLKTKGKQAYPLLMNLITDETKPPQVRAKAIKSLAIFSKQPFDRTLPEDPSYWKATDFRLNELLAWQQAGYLSGAGHAGPTIHPTLHNPKTKLEKTVHALEKRLARARKKHQDLAHPSNWLAIADENEIRAIENKWVLPENYLIFLKCYSPINVYIDNDKFFQGLHVYGAAELLERQAGYSFHGLTGDALEDWPPGYVVIADAGADPYCLDLTNSDGTDAPVYTAVHGAGKWEFEKYTDSFMAFLKDISVG